MATGTPLDQFEFLREIGKGSYGEVSLARHKRDRKQYVIKKILLKKASSRERRSAEQEAKLLSKLKHPNIVSYKQSFEKDGTLFIAMQYCEGGDLYTKLKERKGQNMEERQVVEWFVQIAMALQYMHERNILHRDLKTQNIFLTKSKIIKVGDLGIARVLENSSDMATTLIGTPYYMSPELFSNKPYNHKSDVWALGCCVYEMATLKHAFNAKDMNALVYKILKGKMPLMPKSYSPDLLQLIKSMLHQEPDKRPSVNRILRDPYIKKNISIFLEDTKRSRPSSAASRPGSASRNRPTPSSAVGSRAVLPPTASSSSSTVSSQISVESNNVSHDQVDSQPKPVPVVLRKPSHNRRPSDGARPDLTPIVEGKVSENHQRLGSSSSSDSQDTVKASTVKEKSLQKSESTPRKKRRERHQPGSSGDGGDGVDTDRSEADSVISNNSAPSSPPKHKSKLSIFKNQSDGLGSPKPVDNPRPLPPPPKVEESQGLPQRRRGSEVEEKDASKSSSTSSSKEENASWDIDTPRSLPNMSARERRRQKNPNSASVERPNSARLKLKPQRHESDRITRAEKSEFEPTRHRARQIRQPSIADDSSSSDEGTLKENDIKRDRDKDRENKEMNNFITLLDTTLHMNKEDDKSDDEAPNGKGDNQVDEQPSESEIKRCASLPSVETLCSSSRLMSRIQILHKDCVNGVGFDTLHKAYQILQNIEDDEVEPQLVSLMGREKFDMYAGKIWQLKFCEECMGQLPQLR